MKKGHLNSNIEKCMLPQIQARGWTSDNGIHYKVMSSSVIVAFTLFGANTTQYNGGIFSRLYAPEVFLIHTGIEKEYKQFQAQFFPWCPLATGTLIVDPIYFRLGCLPFFKSKIPQVVTSILTKFHPDSYEAVNWRRYVEEPPFLISDQKLNREGEKLFKELSRYISGPKINSSLVENKDLSEFESEIFEMLNQVDQTALWLYNKASSSELLTSLAVQASTDLNIAILFGPDWPFRIMFILLSSQEREKANVFRTTLDKIEWTKLLRINQKVAEEKMEALFLWVEKNDCTKILVEPIGEEDELYLRACIRMLITPPFTNQRHRNVNTQMTPFTAGMPRVFCEQDLRLLEIKG